MLQKSFINRLFRKDEHYLSRANARYLYGLIRLAQDFTADFRNYFFLKSPEWSDRIWIDQMLERAHPNRTCNPADWLRYFYLKRSISQADDKLIYRLNVADLLLMALSVTLQAEAHVSSLTDFYMPGATHFFELESQAKTAKEYLAGDNPPKTANGHPTGNHQALSDFKA